MPGYVPNDPLARSGQFEKAESWAQTDLGEDAQFTLALGRRDIANALIKAERLEDALVTAQAIWWDSIRAWALSDVAAAFGRAGDARARPIAQDALTAALQVERRKLRAESLRKVAIALAEIGQFNEALMAAHQIDEQISKDMVDVQAETVSAIELIRARNNNEQKFTRLIQANVQRNSGIEKFPQAVAELVPAIAALGTIDGVEPSVPVLLETLRILGWENEELAELHRDLTAQADPTLQRAVERYVDPVNPPKP
ncbi:MAG: hypothetical protein ACYDEO_27005 [Aggregatilineales bacterium]